MKNNILDKEIANVSGSTMPNKAFKRVLTTSTHKLKLALTLVCIGALVACGGGGGEESDTDTPVIDGSGGDSGIVRNPEVGNIELGADNYLAVASSLYSGTVATASTLMVEHGLHLSLMRLGMVSSTPRDCFYSGTSLESMIRDDSSDVSVGDTYTVSYDNCDQYGFTEDGDVSTRVERSSGDYPSGDYSLTLDVAKDLTRTGDALQENNGSYEYQTRVTLAEEEFGDLELIGINVSHLHASETSVIGVDDFALTFQEEALLQFPTGEYLETPSGRFELLAYEHITDWRGIDKRESITWEYDVTNLVDSNLSHSSETISPVVLEERIRIDEEGYDDDYMEGVSGEFVFSMDNGDRIRVEIVDPDGVVPGVEQLENVRVYLDLAGDGTVDARTDVSWEEFTMAFIMFAYSEM